MKQGLSCMPEDWAVEFVKWCYLIIWHHEKSHIWRKVKKLKKQITELDKEWICERLIISFAAH